MDINKNCKLVLNDVFSYDITSCHYSILKNLGLDLNNIDKSDKKGRNIKIGKMMRSNPRLSKILRRTTESTISEYLVRNNIKNDDVILRQYDGVMLLKRLQDINSCTLPIELQNTFSTFIISINRRWYIAIYEKGFVVKGIPYIYPAIITVLEKLARINYANKSTIFKMLENLKKEILESNDIKLYSIPVSENKYTIFLNKYDQITVTENALRYIDFDDIDKNRYFNFYIRPFTESIVLEFI